MVLDEKRLKPAQGLKLAEGTKVVALHPNYKPMWDAKLGSARDENTVRGGDGRRVASSVFFL